MAGFADPNVGRPRMEEEEFPGNGLGLSAVPPAGRILPAPGETEAHEDAERRFQLVVELSGDLFEERKKILQDEKIEPKEKLKLLEANRKMMLNISGGAITKTENVVYGLIVFASLTTIILAVLTTFADLPSEVALAFISTVAGGLIATVAQKIRHI